MGRWADCNLWSMFTWSWAWKNKEEITVLLCWKVVFWLILWEQWWKEKELLAYCQCEHMPLQKIGPSTELETLIVRERLLFFFFLDRQKQRNPYDVRRLYTIYVVACLCFFTNSPALEEQVGNRWKEKSLKLSTLLPHQIAWFQNLFSSPSWRKIIIRSVGHPYIYIYNLYFLKSNLAYAIFQFWSQAN